MVEKHENIIYRVMQSKILRVLGITLSTALLVAGVAVASDSFTVAYGTNQSITAFAICKKVTNSSPTGLSVYVPNTTAAEWASFYGSPPSGVSVGQCSATCGAFTQFRQCTGTTLAVTQYVVFVLATGISQCKAFCENNVAGATCCEFRNREGITPSCRVTNGGVVAGTYDYYSASCN